MAIALTTPDYRVFQRNPVTGKGTIIVTGTGATPGHVVEARWKGGVWTAMTVAGDGSFSGSLTEQNSGQGDLEVRQDGGGVADTAVYVGVGSIFVGAGASNVSGRGDNNQSYSHATLKACLFNNRYTWAEMTDPTDYYGLQTDTVSRDDNPAAAGSWIPHFATHFMAEYGYPVAYVPCPMGGSAAEGWDDIGTDRSTLFGSMAYRIQQVGGAELVIWIANGSNIESYKASMNAIADALPTYGCDYLMQIGGVQASGYTPAWKRTFWKEQERLARSNSHIVNGTRLSAIKSDDTLHMMTDYNLAFAGRRIFEAVKTFKTVLEGGNLRQTI